MILHTKYLFAVLALISILFAQTANLFAFSLGGIEVKNNFGEKFLAEIELMVDEKGDVHVAIGSEEDFRRLQLKRLSIVDDLRLEGPFVVNEQKQMIKVVSDKPLFFPSFNLVVKASQSGGTLIENYLITVDFQQSVSLGMVKGKSAKDKKESENEKKEPAAPESVPSPKPVEPPKETTVVAKTEETVKQEPPVVPQKNEAVEKQMPLEVQEKAEPRRFVFPQTIPLPPDAARATFADTIIAPLPILSPEIKQMPAEPVPLEPRSFSEIVAIPIATPGADEEKNAKKEKKKKRDPQKAEPKVASSVTVEIKPKDIYGPIISGETLLDVSKKLKKENHTIAQVSAAIWLDNRDQFIFGNVHGVRKGAVLNLDHLEKRLAQIMPQTANAIMANHWREWKIIRQKLSLPEGSEAPLNASEVPLPAEKLSDKAGIFRWLAEWKSSWEYNDMDRHKSFYSPHFKTKREENRKFDLVRWMQYKQEMFKHGNKMGIYTGRSLLISMGDKVFVSFDQGVDVGSVKNFGIKKLELAREEGWRIIDEPFNITSHGVAHNQALYVVQASSHEDSNSAQETVNKWRERGFNAYWSTVTLTKGRVLYRVFLERFANWSNADEYAQALRKLEFRAFPIPSPLPYSMIVDIFNSEEQAAQTIQSLRKGKISALLMSGSGDGFSNPQFKVLVGAYGNENDSLDMKNKLSGAGIAARFAIP